MDSQIIRETLRQQPFQPFVMELVDGRKLVVRHPEFVLVSKRHLIHVDEEDHLTWVEPLLVITMKPLDSSPSSTGEDGKLLS